MIEKGADSWNLGMYGAARGNHLFLVEYFTTKGANNWKMVLQGAHGDLVPFFEQKIRETEAAPLFKQKTDSYKNYKNIKCHKEHRRALKPLHLTVS